MRILLLGGTRFIGPPVVRQLTARGHAVTVFHRGQTQADLPDAVEHLYGQRAALPRFRETFCAMQPDVVIDLNAYTERDVEGLVEALHGLAPRVVLISSQDVYRAFSRFLRKESGPPDPLPIAEDAPLRDERYPYRSTASNEAEMRYQYDKILVEDRLRAEPSWAWTILRLPQVYGPGDYQHRFFPYVKRMADRRPAILMGEQQATWRWTRGYVENVAAAIVNAAEDERAADAVFNVGEPDAWTEAEWVQRVAAAMDWSGRIEVVPEDDLPASLRLDLDWRQELVIDTSKVRDTLGVEPLVPSEEALRRTVAWERTHPPDPVAQPAFDYAAEDAVLARLHDV